MLTEIKSKKAITFIIAFCISCATAVFYYGQIADDIAWKILLWIGGIGLECYHIVLATEVKNLNSPLVLNNKRRKFKVKQFLIYVQYLALALMAINSTFMCLLVKIESKDIKQSIPRAKIEILQRQIAILEQKDFVTDKESTIYKMLDKDTNEWAAINLLKQAQKGDSSNTDKIKLLSKYKIELATYQKNMFGIKSGFHLLAEVLGRPGAGNKLMLLSALFFSLMLVVAMGRSVDGTFKKSKCLKKSGKKSKNGNQIAFEDVMDLRN